LLVAEEALGALKKEINIKIPSSPMPKTASPDYVAKSIGGNEVV